MQRITTFKEFKKKKSQELKKAPRKKEVAPQVVGDEIPWRITRTDIEPQTAGGIGNFGENKNIDMKHIKSIQEASASDKQLVDVLIGDLVTSFYDQVKNLNRTSIKRTTWAALINDVVPSIIKDENEFDDADRKLFRDNKDKILKKVLGEIMM